MKIRNVLLCFISFLIFSCQSSFEQEKALLNYIQDEDNGYYHRKEIMGTIYELQYKPTDLVVKHQLHSKLQKQSLDELRKKYNQFLYFTLSLKKNDEENIYGIYDEEQYSETLYDISFGLAKNIYLLTQKRDTLHVIDSVYPRLYGMGQSTIVLIAFKRDSKKLEDDFLYLIIEGIGPAKNRLSFKIPTEPLKNEPRLELISNK
jgi:hypothetical protein